METDVDKSCKNKATDQKSSNFKGKYNLIQNDHKRQRKCNVLEK